MKMNKKLIVATVACAALLVGSISTSLAWLLDTTEAVTNTFTTSTLGVTLTETDPSKEGDDKTVSGLNIQMVPGWTYHKDPTVKVQENSEDCYVFLKVVKDANLDNFIDYNLNVKSDGNPNGWTKLVDASITGFDVYYMEYKKNSNAVTYDVLLAGSSTYFTDEIYSWDKNQVMVKPTIKKEDMAAQTSSLTFQFTAYASQYWKNKTTDTKFMPIEAWNNVKDNPA